MVLEGKDFINGIKEYQMIGIDSRINYVDVDCDMDGVCCDHRGRPPPKRFGYWQLDCLHFLKPYF
jgi:hypothetical protein